ncbi:MAG: zinc ribbon domain-containing protein [Chloroflexi bacterium]|nr:zinc ribbon domain-containing protein [Chloroflexota bacterium]
MFCPKCGKETPENQAFCSGCGAPRQGLGTTNTSGMGPLAQIPPEIKGWNWGAFFLGWIWGLGNSVWIALIEWVPYVGWVMAFVLGAKGSEWAWAAKKWDSVEDFKRTQRTWALWGLGWWIAVAAILVLIIALVVLISD